MESKHLHTTSIDPPPPDIDVTHLSPSDKRKGTRPWSQITGITLHQTAVHKFGVKAWPRVTAHLGVHADGNVYWIHPLQSYLWASNGFNASTVAIEVAGNYRREEGAPGSFWKPGGGPSQLTPAMIAGLRRAIRFICAEVERHGGRITRVHAHRQASADRPACPGEAIWRAGGLWAQLELGLDDGGDGFKIGTGKPIPRAWDERRGVLELALAAAESTCDCSELDAEFPDDDALAALAAARRGVIVRSVPAGVELSLDPPVTASAARRRRTVSSDAEHDLVADALTRDDLQLVDTILLEPGATELRAPVTDRFAAADADALRFDLPVSDGEGAVALVERDGAYHWLLPGGPAAHGMHRFNLPADAVPAPRSGRRDGGGWWGRIKLRVFRFLVGGVARLAIAAYEGRRREGFVELQGPHVNDWIAVDTPPPARRVLLLLHGTFSSTVGCFGPLSLAREQSLIALARANATSVLGYDHHTLGKTPAQNAEQLADALVRAGLAGAELEIVCHSRGGLVARSLAHALAARGARPIRRVVCVATTENGTRMADPSCWHELADVMTNVTSAAGLAWSAVGGAPLASVAVPSTIAGIAALVKVLSTGILHAEAVPGLAAMTPGAALHAAYPPWDETLCARRFAVFSNFSSQARTGGLVRASLLWAADRIVDRLFGQLGNDLVVDNDSTRFGAGERDVIHEIAGGAVHHGDFFAEPRLLATITGWLDLTAVGPDFKSDGINFVSSPRAGSPPRRRRRGGIGLESTLVAAEAPARELTELWMHAHAPAAVRPSEPFWVLVDLAPEPETIGLGEKGLIDPSALVEVELVARRNAVVGAAAKTVVQAPAPGTALRVGLNARALASGEVQLRVLVRQQDVVVMHGDVVLDARADVGDAPVLTREADNRDVVRLAGALPDHQLEIITLFEPGAMRLRYNLISPANGVRDTFESGRIAGDLARFVDGLYARVESEWDRADHDPAKFERILPAIGSMLFTQLFPPPLREALWQLRDGLAGLQIVSDEQFIPWELVCLTQPDGRLVDGARFLAELGLVRALWDATLAPAIRVRDAYVVAPDYPPPHTLLASAAEQAALRTLFNARTLSPGSQDVIDLVQRRGSFDLLHFICHGELGGGDAELLLGAVRDGRWTEDSLVSGEVAARGEMRGPDGERPLVFINACSVGRGQQLLTSMGGWASAFLKRGAGAVVAPLWSVGDRAARHFAETFYAGLLAGGSFAEAAAQARAAARRRNDPTWLAYAVYADPHGRVAG